MKSAILAKYKYYLYKILKIYSHSFNPKAIYGRFIGKKILLNSIPKAGTHLLEKVFEEMPYYRHFGKRTIRRCLFSNDNNFSNAIANIKTGQFGLGHIHYEDKILDVLEKNEIKLIIIKRDPRDILCSHEKFVTEIDKTHKSHKYFNDIKNFDDRIKSILYGVDTIVEPFQVVLRNFIRWTEVKSDNILTVSFEDLIGEKGAGSSQGQENVVKEIIIFCGMTKYQDEILSKKGNFYSKNSSTFNTGKIGNWKDKLSPKLKELIEKEIKNEIISLGYKV